MKKTEPIGPTPEQLRQASYAPVSVPRKHHQERIAQTVRRMHQLELLQARGVIDHDQCRAGLWLSDVAALASGSPAPGLSMGRSGGGGIRDHLPHTNAVAEARDDLRWAMDAIPAALRLHLTRVCVEEATLTAIASYRAERRSEGLGRASAELRLALSLLFNRVRGRLPL